MVTEFDIINEALYDIGEEEEEITSWVDNERLQGVYERERDWLQECYPFPFGLDQASLAVIDWVTATDYVVGNMVLSDGISYKCLVDNTSDVLFSDDLDAGYWKAFPIMDYDFALELPSDLLRFIKINDLDIDDINHEIMDKHILIDVAEAECKYIKLITDYTKFNKQYRKCLIKLCSINIANSITEKLSMIPRLEREYEALITKAKGTIGQQQKNPRIQDSSAIRVRG